jgi:hypothetical protein
MSVASLKQGFASWADNPMTKALKRLFAAQRSSFLFGSAVLDQASLATGAGAAGAATVTVTGAALGDIVIGVSASVDLAGLQVTGYVSAANTVALRFRNDTGGAVDLASATYRVIVAKASNWSSKYLMGLEAP